MAKILIHTTHGKEDVERASLAAVVANTALNSAQDATLMLTIDGVWLATKGYDPVFGARPLARVIQREVRDPLTDEILFGRLEQGGTVTIGLEEGRLTFAFQAAASKDTELTDSGR